MNETILTSTIMTSAVAFTNACCCLVVREVEVSPLSWKEAVNVMIAGAGVKVFFPLTKVGLKAAANAIGPVVVGALHEHKMELLRPAVTSFAVQILLDKTGTSFAQLALALEGTSWLHVGYVW